MDITLRQSMKEKIMKILIMVVLNKKNLLENFLSFSFGLYYIYINSIEINVTMN